MKKEIALTAGLLLALSMTACGAPAQAPAATEASETLGSIQNMVNPYLTCEDAETMQAEAGFEVSLPAQLPDWVTETIYRTIPGELIEVIYAGEGNEIRVRVAGGSVDISGVYDSDQKEEKDITVNGRSVHLKGETGEDGVFTAFVSTWNTPEGRTYSVTSTQGVAEDVLSGLIADIV